MNISSRRPSALKGYLQSAAILACSVTLAVAAPITYDGQTTAGQMPGSPDDYAFFGDPIDGHTDAGGPTGRNHPSVLDDVSVSVLPDTGIGTFEGYDPSYADILAPDGATAADTGLLYDGSTSPVNYFTITLGSTPGFNYGNFHLYVMFSNGDLTGGDVYTRIQTISLTLTGSESGSINQSVTDANADNTVADFAEFTITGAAAGDVITVGTTKLDNPGTANGYVSGFSIEEAPEPAVFAMVLGGLGLLVLVRRFRTVST